MQTSNNLILFDTNIIIYNQDASCKQFEKSAAWHQKVINGEIKGVIASQNFVEFISVITNPKKIVKPLSQEKASLEIEKYFSCQAFKHIYPTEKTFSIFLNLSKKYQIKNSLQFFDLYLVSTILSWGIKKILTFNTEDFKKLEEIEIVKP